MKIYKYPLSVASVQEVVIPSGAVILDLQVQNGYPCIWAKILEPNLAHGREYYFNEIRTFITIGTGHEFSEKNLTYVGTYQLAGFVGHVFEQRSIR